MIEYRIPEREIEICRSVLLQSTGGGLGGAVPLGGEGEGVRETPLPPEGEGPPCPLALPLFYPVGMFI